MHVGHFYEEHHNNTTDPPGPQQRQCETNVPQWFHGVTSRKAAETLLLAKPPGYFLIRVAESRNGYTLSYRAADRCRHFMIEEMRDGNYSVTGENTRHRTLQDLVDFHYQNPIMPFNDLLTVPCRQMSEATGTAECVPATLTRHTSLPAILPFSALAHHPDATPTAFNSQLRDQLDLQMSLVNTPKPTVLPRRRYTTPPYNTTTQAHLAPDIPAEVPRLLETVNNNNLYSTLATSTPSTSGMTAVFTPEHWSARQEDNQNAGGVKPSAMYDNTNQMALFRMKMADEVLPQEYDLPPPYAPGYH